MFINFDALHNKIHTIHSHPETGRTFGEVALMTEDSVRNASIVADEDVDLLVIHKDLYNHTLKVCHVILKPLYTFLKDAKIMKNINILEKKV